MPGIAALAALPRDRPAFVLLRKDSAQLGESERPELDTAVIEAGCRSADARPTPSAVAAEEAVRISP